MSVSDALANKNASIKVLVEVGLKKTVTVHRNGFRTDVLRALLQLTSE